MNQPIYTRVDLELVDITTPAGWEAFNTDATAQWLDTCDEQERAEYYRLMGIQIGEV
jgi:hypothetical protein